MKYACFERHNNGNWWYHGNSFNTFSEAQEFLDKWIWWDQEREKVALEINDKIDLKKIFKKEKSSLYTKNFKTYYTPGGKEVLNLENWK